MALWQEKRNVDSTDYSAIASNRLLYEVPLFLALLLNSSTKDDDCGIRLFLHF